MHLIHIKVFPNSLFIQHYNIGLHAYTSLNASRQLHAIAKTAYMHGSTTGNL